MHFMIDILCDGQKSLNQTSLLVVYSWTDAAFVLSNSISCV